MTALLQLPLLIPCTVARLDASSPRAGQHEACKRAGGGADRRFRLALATPVLTVLYRLWHISGNECV